MKRLVASLGLLLLAGVIATGGAALYSEAGLRWVLAALDGVLPGELTLGRVQGRLAGPIEGDELHYRTGDTLLSLRHFKLNWHLGSLLTGNLHITRLRADGLRLQLAAAGDDGSLPPRIAPPLGLLFDQVEINELTLQTATTTLALEKLSAQGEWLRDILHLASLRLDHAAGSLQLNGTATLSERYALHAQTEWHWQAADMTEAVSASGSVRGDIDELLFDQLLKTPAEIRLLMKLRQPTVAPHWQISATATRLDQTSLPLLPAGISLPAASLQAEGDWQEFQAQGEFSALAGGLGPWHGQWRLSYQENNFVLQQLTLSDRDHSGLVRASGKLQWLDTPVYELQTDWRNLTLADTGTVRSPQGHWQLAGKGENYRTDFNLSLEGPNLPAGRWSGRGQGDLRQLRLSALQGRILAGTVDGELQLTRLPHWQWTSRWRAQRLNLAQTWPDWDAQLDGKVTIDGSNDDAGLRLQAQISELQGKLRDQALSGKAAASLDSDGWHIHKLQLQAASSSLALSGDLGNKLALQWQFRSENLADLRRDAGGRLISRGSLRGSGALPVLDAELDATDLRWSALTLTEAHASAHLDRMHDDSVALRIYLRQLQLQGRRFDSLKVNAEGNAGAHTLSFDARNSQQSLVGRVTAGYDNDHWQGRMQELSLHDADAGDWVLARIAPLQYRSEAWLAGNICLQQVASYLCLDKFAWSAQSRQLSLSASKFPLRIVQSLLPSGLGVGGSVDAGLHFFQAPDRMLTVRGNASVADGNVRWQAADPAAHPITVQLSAATLLINGNMPGALDLDVSGTLESKDKISAHARWPDLPAWPVTLAEQPVSGQLAVSLSDFAWLESLAPELDTVQGKIDVHALLEGSAAKPQFSGSLRLRDGGLHLPRFGVELSAIELQAASAGPRQFKLSGGARSGEGTLSLNGDIGYDAPPAWRMNLAVQGENFEVARIPELRLAISPQLDLQLQPGNVRIDGDIAIPQARIEPRDIRRAVSASDDVIVVGRQAETPAQEQWQIISRLHVTADDSVRFLGYDFDGRIGGDLVVQDEPGKPTRASGELHSVKGSTYLAFKRKLEVEQGRLLFADTPLDNPSLDVSAIRTTGDIVSGIKVSGTMKAPVLTLFSRPPMDETNILSYLTLGRPLNTASRGEGETLADAAQTAGLAGGDYLAHVIGQQFGLEEARLEQRSDSQEPWLMLGTYLSPRLYVRYGIGLYESGHSVLMRYQLQEHWQVQGETGSSGGVDLLYSRDR